MDFGLNILPPGGLSSSVITCVWVGVMVVVFFNLRFGTTLSGLVVPGYLIPLFIVHPVSGYVIIAESIITYFIARFIAEKALIRLGLGEMFGRDRFFILILISILVRVIADGFLLPPLGEQLQLWGAPYELRSGLHSFGLIIIALCANQFWNGGFKVGIFTLTLYLIVTYLLVLYALMPLTNFNISTLGYMYEDIATSILASPKAYIVLVTAAYISSRMNLRYGWDFNGILIPSLLALQWYDPLKILVTFVEAFVILIIARGLIQLPVLNKINFEGARQMLLFFNVGFAYKLILGFAVIHWMPEQKVSDLYGFGYILATLMALKMFQKGIAIRFTRTTVQTSLSAVIVASIVGFSLTLFDPLPTQAQASSIQNVSYQTLNEPIDGFVDKVRADSYRSEGSQQQTKPLPTQLVDISTMLRTLPQLENPPGNMLNLVAAQAQKVGYQMSFIESRYLVLHDTQPERGWGIFIVDTHAKSQLALQVPRALDEPKAAAVALPLMRALGAKYLAYAGARATRTDDGSDDVLLNAQSPLQLFHQNVANNNTLQLRSYTRSAARQLLGLRQQSTFELDINQSAIYIKRTLPEDLNLKRLEQLLGDFTVNWHSPNTQNRQRETAINGFGEIYLNDDSLLNIFTQALSDQDYQSLAREQRIDGYLQNYLNQGKLNVAAKHSNDYQAADKHQLMYFDQAVLQEVLALVDKIKDNDWQPKHDSRLRQIADAASRFDYEVLLYRHISTNARYVIFQPFESAQQQKYWGTYVIKVGAASNFIVEVPRPQFEQNTYEFGAALFEALNARALLVTGAHPMANVDGSAQLTSVNHPDSLFNLFHQSLLSHYADNSPFAVQVRGFAPAALENQALSIVAHFEYQKPAAKKHPDLGRLKAVMKANGLDLLEPDENQIDQRFQAKLNAQSRYTRFINDAQYAEVWLPTLLRQQFKHQQQDDQLSKKIAAVGFEKQAVDVKSFLGEQRLITVAPEKLEDIKALLKEFEQSQNISLLMKLKSASPKVTLLQDNNTRQYFITFSNAQGLMLAANLNPLNGGQSDNDSKRFFDNRRHFLHLGGQP